MEKRALLNASAIMAMAVALSSPAMAQTVPASPVDQASLAPAGEAANAGIDTPPASSSGATPDIVVTGSRIARRDFVSNSPIATVDAAAFKQSGSVTLEDALNRLPQVVPARGATSNDGLTGGITTIDLRGLGANRTLILQDSRRLMAATTLGQVDINNIPPALIQDVEIVTGGASAAYGSDAIAGVVNFKINKRFTGVQIDAQNGISSRGDGFTTQGSLTAGTTYGGGRGHAEFSVTYGKRNSVENAARDFSSVVRPSSSLPQGVYIATAGNLPTQAALDALFAKYGFPAGTVSNARNVGFNTNGTLFGYQTNDANFQSPANGVIDTPGTSVRYNASGVAQLITPLERVSVYAHTDYDVTDTVNLYAEGNYQHFTSSGVYGPGNDTVSVPVTNPFIPSDLATLLASRANPTANFTVTKKFAELGYRIQNTTTDNFQVRGGAKGSLGIGDLTWDVYGSYGRSDQTYHNLNGISISAADRLVSAADGGASLCAGGLNLFGLQANTACDAYIRRNTTIEATSDQKIGEATVQGSLFTLPAGDVRFAAGIDYREDTFHYTPDAVSQSGDLISFSNGSVPAVSGSVRAKEAYGELSMPILADLPFVRKLEVNAGYRYSDYNTSGGVSSFRAEGNWQLASLFRLRGGFARAVRAPSVEELYAPTSQSSPSIGTPRTIGQGDPCDVRGAYRTGANAAQVRALCLAQGVPASLVDSYIFDSAQIQDGGTTGGNRNLKPEVADTYTIGGVITPDLDTPWLSRLSISADFYSISLKSAVGTISGQTAIQKCYNLNGTNADYSRGNYYCSLFGRSAATGQINAIALYNLNLGSVKTSGVDMAADWSVDLAQIAPSVGGALRVQGSATWLRRYGVQTLPGETATDYAGYIGYDNGQSVTALPYWKSTVNVAYTRSDVTIGFQYRYIGGMIDASVVDQTDTADFRIPSYHYFDVNGSIRMNDRFVYRMGVNNLGDKRPPVFSSFDQSNTLPTVYDVLGRSFYAGLTATF